MEDTLLIKKIQVGTQAYSVYDERVKVAEVPADAKFTDTTYTGTQGITVTGTNIKHSNEVTAVGTQGLLNISYDAYGHITGSTAVTKEDITALGIPSTNTTYTGTQGIELDGTTFKHSNSIGAQGTQGLYKISWDAQGHITGVTAVAKDDITALGIPGKDTTYTGTQGIELSGTTFKHSNSISPQDTAVFKKIKYDAYGHITGVADVEASDISGLIADATNDITRLETLVNKIKAELEDPSSTGLTSVLETMQNILNSSADAVTGITYAKQELSVDPNGVLLLSEGSVTPTKEAFVTANTTVTPVSND